MATATEAVDPERELIDRDRWDGRVVGDVTRTLTWGVWEFEVRVQEFEDTTGHMSVRTNAPNPPPSADEIVTHFSETHPRFAALLADRWGVDVDELAEADR